MGLANAVDTIVFQARQVFMRTRYYGTNIENRFTASNEIRESFYGRGGDDIFTIFHHGNSSGAGADLSDRFFGGSGNDWIEALSFDFTNGALLSDYRQLSFDGGVGYDTVSVDVVAQATGGLTLDLSAIETSVRSVEHWDYDIALGAPVSEGEFTILGGSLDDSIDISQLADATGSDLKVKTLGGDDVVRYAASEDLGTLDVNTGNGNDYFVFSADWDVTADIAVNTGRGNDTVVINGSTISHSEGLSADIRTGKGNDTIVLDGMHGETLNAGNGSDDIYILTGSFANAADTIKTGGGRDRLFVELDSYSTVAVVQDFNASKDVFVFDQDEAGELLPRNTLVTFDRSEWEDADEDRLFMDNDADRLYFGDNVLVEFNTDVTLTTDNFTSGEWEFFA